MANDRFSNLPPGLAADNFWQLLAAKLMAPRLPDTTGSCRMLERSEGTGLHGKICTPAKLIFTCSSKSSSSAHSVPCLATQDQQSRRLLAAANGYPSPRLASITHIHCDHASTNPQQIPTGPTAQRRTFSGMHATALSTWLAGAVLLLTAGLADGLAAALPPSLVTAAPPTDGSGPTCTAPWGSAAAAASSISCVSPCTFSRPTCTFSSVQDTGNGPLHGSSATHDRVRLDTDTCNTTKARHGWQLLCG